MTQYVINNDQTVKARIDNERNKVKDKADIIEGLLVKFIMLHWIHCETKKFQLLSVMASVTSIAAMLNELCIPDFDTVVNNNKWSK